jgi:hypothetical protein
VRPSPLVDHPAPQDTEPFETTLPPAIDLPEPPATIDLSEPPATTDLSEPPATIDLSEPPATIDLSEVPAIDLPEPTGELMADASMPPDYQELAPVSIPTPPRRAMWLIPILILAVVAGIGVGVLVARSLGVRNPPAAQR